MKVKVKIIAIIFSVLFLVSTIFSQTSNPLKNKFSFGIVSELLRKYKYQTTFHEGKYDSLKLDIIHSYSNRGDNDDPLHPYFGGFYDNIITYSGAVDSSINYYPAALKIFERAKIVRAAYGQRSTYQAEEFPLKTFPKYYYATPGPGIDWTDTVDGVLVRKCVAGVDTQGYIVKDLIENCEQINRPNRAENKTWDIEYMISDYKDSLWTWYVKPKMRIDSSVANNINMQNVVVVNLVIKSFTGDSIVKPITVSNFKNSPNYNGEYIEIYFDDLGRILDLSVKASYLCSGANGNNSLSSKVDYRIYWPGNVSVCLDYVRLDDEWAHFLFNDSLDFDSKYDFRTKLQQEITAFGDKDLLNYFYMDECPINSFPCIAEVNKIIKQPSANPTKGLFAIMMEETAMHDYGYLRHLPSIDEYTDYILEMDDSLMTDVFLYTCYPFHNRFKIPSNLTANDMGPGIQYVTASSPADYNNSMMSYFQLNTYNNNGDTLSNGQVVLSYNIMSKMIKKSNLAGRDISPAFFIQAHSFEYSMADNLEWYNLREPTNEEMMLQGNLALIYGAKQVYLFSYSTDVRDSNSKKYYSYGLMNDTAGTIIRRSNYFGQNKWLGAIKVSENLQKIGDVLYPAGTNNTMHMTYVDSRSVNPITYPTGIGSGLPFLYINELRSQDPNINGQNPCVETGIMTDYYDCPNERYWELGFFDQPSSSTDGVSKYFIALNKRCTPDTPGYHVDTRILKLRFNSSYFSGYNNWMIKDAVTNEVISKFDKNSTTFVNAGTYKPAEAKLLKIVPVMVEGDTLITNETLSGNINCKGMVYNGGHNITISPNTTITFSDSAGIEMNGGCFVSGVNADNADAVTLTGKSSNTFWKGITLIGCDSIGVYNTNISNIKANDTAKAFSIINSYKVNFRKNTINANSNSGGIQAVYNSFSDNPIVFNVRECTFNMNQSGYSAISVLSNASVTLPIVTEWCLFNSQNDTSNAILFNEVTGGVIKNNIFTNFGKSVVLMYSTTDLYGNTILGKNNSQGILCLSGSNVSLSPTSGQYLGGYNYIKNYGTSASNVYSNNSYFNIQNGQNDFDLSDIDNSKHLTGDLNGMTYAYVNATKNCFHKDSITNVDATHSVIWNGSTDPVNFVFTDYSCELTPPGDYFVYQYGGYNDTVYYSSGGEGGGFNPNKPMNIEENVYKSLKDSININLRKRNYLTVEDKAKQLLTQYPDSLESAAMVQKLYMASLSLDSTKIGITKTFLENLIAANTQNPTLIKRAFYFIQKCKVKLGQYQSALDGFQYIMTQNPYTYEGLVASWDYAATFLLMGSGGSNEGNFEQTTEELNTPADTLLNRMTKRDINTNKSSNNNSTEQITKTFYEKIKNVTKNDKAAQEEKVKTLE